MKPNPSPHERVKVGSGVQLTTRDIAILEFINMFGFCETAQLNRRFELRCPRNYQVMNRLIKAGLVTHQRVFHDRPGIYRLTKRGAGFTDLPPLSRLRLGNYRHDVMVIDLYLALRQRYPEAQWVSERALMRDKHTPGVGQRGHLPDGVLLLPEQKSIAVEIELSMKGKHRLERILKGYSAAFDYGAVWYYCSDAVAAYIASMAARMPFIKIHRLQEWLT